MPKNKDESDKAPLSWSVAPMGKKSKNAGGGDGKSSRSSPKKKRRKGKSPQKGGDDKAKTTKGGKKDEITEYADLLAKAEYELELYGPEPVDRDIMYLHASACDVDFLNHQQGNASDPSASGDDHVQKITHETFKQDVRVFDAYDNCRRSIDWDEVKKNRKPEVTSTYVNPKWKGLYNYFISFITYLMINLKCELNVQSTCS